MWNIVAKNSESEKIRQWATKLDLNSINNTMYIHPSLFDLMQTSYYKPVYPISQ